MKMGSLAVLIHKLRRKGIKGTFWAAYYRMLVRIVGSFPSSTLSPLEMEQLDTTVIDSNWGYADVCVSSKSRFHFSVEERDRIVDLIPVSLRRNTIESAEEVMSYHFRFKGESYRFSKSIDWFLDPSGNKGWRWDLNRHLFLITLAKAYLYSKEPKYLQRIEHIITDWVTRNPLNLKSANWNEPFEVAARLSNWIWLYYLLKDSDETAQGLTLGLLKGIHSHGVYLFWLMEIHIPNNHLLLEARALYHASTLLDHSTPGRKWARKSLKYLCNEFKRQVRNDGGHSEQSITYHRIINSELWETYLLMSKNSKLASLPQFRSTLVAMTEFLRWMMRPDGSFPLTGDSSAVDTYYRFNPFMISAALLDRPDLKSAAMLLGEDDLTFFAMGAELADKYKRMEPQPPAEGSMAFEESGYYMMQDKSTGLHALIDCGPFCDDLIPAHGHDDILSVDLTMDSSPLFIDSGNDGLPADAPRACLWREYFRGARSHNVLVLNHSNRSLLSGYRDVLRVARPLACEWRTAESVDYFVGAHDGYLPLFGVIQQREIILVKGQFLCVLDRLIGKGDHQVEILYHLAPDKKAVVSDQAVKVLNEMGPFAQMVFFGIPGDIRISRGDMNPIQGWVSPESGCRMQADTICWRASSKLPLCIGTIIQLHKRAMFKVESMTGSHDLAFDFVLSSPDADYKFSAGSHLTRGDPRNPKFRGPFIVRRRTGGGIYVTLFDKDHSYDSGT